MKFMGFCLLASTVLANGASADVYQPISRVDSVTVFAMGADVTRQLEVELKAGDHQLILEDLPGEIETTSIRVSGEGGQGVEIASVDSKLQPIRSEDTDADRKRLQKQIDVLLDERAALDQTLADAETQRQFLMGLADKHFVPAASTDAAKSLDPASFGGLLDVMGQRLDGLAKIAQAAKARQKQIDEASAELQRAISLLAPEGEERLRVTVHLAAAQAATTKFKISYRIQNAAWRPYYDAKLKVPQKGGPAKLELVRRAEVSQSTTESWDNVQLTLSTARPMGTTIAPDIGEQEIHAHEQLLGNEYAASKVQLNSRSKKQFDEPLPASPAALAQPELSGIAEDAAVQRQAAIEISGYQASYSVTGRVSIDNSGSSKRVRITGDALNAKLSVVSVPRQDTNAYLTASFAVSGDGPLLPGTVNLYRDEVYVGQGALPILAAGEDAKLGFGVDDQVKITRKEIKRQKSEEGIISTSNVESRLWDIAVKNLHDFEMPVTILDRLPYATIDDVQIVALPGTEPTEKDVEKKRGVLAWQLPLKARTEQTIRFGYKVVSPKEIVVGMVD